MNVLLKESGMPRQVLVRDQNEDTPIAVQTALFGKGEVKTLALLRTHEQVLGESQVYVRMLAKHVRENLGILYERWALYLQSVGAGVDGSGRRLLPWRFPELFGAILVALRVG